MIRPGTVVADLVPRENVSPEVGKFYPDAEGSRRWIIDFCRSSAAGSLRSTRANADLGLLQQGRAVCVDQEVRPLLLE